MTAPDPSELTTKLVGKTLADRYLVQAVRSSDEKGAELQARSLKGAALAISVVWNQPQPPDSWTRLGEVQHPHLQNVLDAGHDEKLQLSYAACDPLSGETVSALANRLGRVDPVAAVRIVLQACRGTLAAERASIALGAITGDTLFLEKEDDEVLVRVSVDALARAGGAEAKPVWALGAVLYQLLCGVRPLEAPKHLQELAPWVEPGLAVSVHQALRTDGGWPNIEAFTNALRSFADGDELLTADRLVKTSPEQSAARPEKARLDRAFDSYLPPPPDPKDEMSLVGKKLGGRFSVNKLLGRGGMGAVYQVKDESGAEWAAKVISEGVTKESPSAMKRFAREAETATTIRSPHVVKTLEADTDRELGLPFIIMELMQGSDLSVLMKDLGIFKPTTAVRLMMQAAYGVSAAHKQGIIHRDIKPANLFLHSDQGSDIVTVKVCDFGVAKRTQMAAYDTSSYNLTRTGRMLGSPMYMSPEQARSAKHVDERSDVWSLCVVLWELLSGQRLWADKKSLGELVLAICSDPIPKLSVVAPWVPNDLSNVVARGLEREVERRHAKVEILAQALEVFSRGSFDVQKKDLVTLSTEESDSIPPENGRGSATRISRTLPLQAPKLAYVGEPAASQNKGAWLWLVLGVSVVALALGVTFGLR